MFKYSRRSLMLVLAGMVNLVSAATGGLTWPNGLPIVPIRQSAGNDFIRKAVQKANYNQIYFKSAESFEFDANSVKSRDPLDTTKVVAGLFAADLLFKAQGSALATGVPRGFAATGLLLNLALKDKDVEVADTIRASYVNTIRPGIVMMKLIDAQPDATLNNQLMTEARNALDFLDEEKSGLACPLKQVDHSLFGVAYSKSLAMYYQDLTSAYISVGNCHPNSRLLYVGTQAGVVAEGDPLFDPNKKQVLVSVILTQIDKFANTGQLSATPVKDVLSRLVPVIGPEWIIQATPDEGGKRLIMRNKRVIEYPLPEDPFSTH